MNGVTMRGIFIIPPFQSFLFYVLIKDYEEKPYFLPKPARIS